MESLFCNEYPKEVSPLSRDHRDKDGLTERLKELLRDEKSSTGFSELVDSEEQMERFKDQLEKVNLGMKRLWESILSTYVPLSLVYRQQENWNRN